MRNHSKVIALCVAALVGCGKSPTVPAENNNDGEFIVAGDATAARGATWTFRGTVAGVSYDLQGVLFKPSGSGPFPAVVISHGAGGNAAGYSSSVAGEMVKWGMVAIATNYTHAGGVALGAPGTASETGASSANVSRAHLTYTLLRRLGYVDMSRVAAHGHSMGAFVTAALIGAHSADFRAASHTAGGARPGTSVGALPAPVESQVQGIRVPYQMHHGDRDVVVQLAADRLLESILAAQGVTHELHVYAGADHDDVTRDATVLSRVRGWYLRHGVLR